MAIHGSLKSRQDTYSHMFHTELLGFPFVGSVIVSILRTPNWLQSSPERISMGGCSSQDRMQQDSGLSRWASTASGAVVDRTAGCRAVGGVTGVSGICCATCSGGWALGWAACGNLAPIGGSEKGE